MRCGLVASIPRLFACTTALLATPTSLTGAGINDSQGGAVVSGQFFAASRRLSVGDVADRASFTVRHYTGRLIPTRLLQLRLSQPWPPIFGVAVVTFMSEELPCVILQCY